MIVFAVNDSLKAISRPLDFSAFTGAGHEPARVVEVWTLG